MDAVRTYLPHAPDLGLYLAPEIPSRKLRGALDDYARGVAAEDVLALYDATRFGSGKDGVVFLADRMVVQNHDLEAPRTLHYAHVVGVKRKRNVLGGARVEVDVNRGRATVMESLDFSAHAGAAEYVERLLEQIVLTPPEERAASGATDRRAVEAALSRLVGDGQLTEEDRARMLDALDRRL